MDKTTSIVFQCDVCRNDYYGGIPRHEGHRLHLYGDISCCDTCWKGNHDGWAPRYEPILLEHLRRQGIPEPPRVANGLLPRN